MAKYTNDGSTYAGVTIVAGSSDKQSIAVDTTGGQYSDSVYIVMDNSVGGTVVFTHSSDGGGTFASPVPVGGRHGALAVAPDGTVYIVTWDNGNLLHISKVHPGGTILTTNIASIPIIPIPSPLPGGSFRTGNNPQIASDSYGIYVTWAEYGSGTSEVEFTKSTDGGISWTRPTRVSDGSSGEHFFPAIASFNGVIGIVWYDSRLNTKSSLNSLDVYYAQSIDGGVSFSPNIRVTNISFDPEQVLRGDAPSNNNPFIGDYIGISAGSSGIFPVWADNRNACDNIDPTFGCVDQDAFTAVVLQSAVPSSPDPCLFCILLPLPTLLWLIIIGAVSAGLGYIAGSRRSGRKGPISRRFRQNRIPR